MVGKESDWMKALQAILELAVSAQQEVLEEVEEDDLPSQVLCAICCDNWAPYYLPETGLHYCSRHCLTEGRTRALLAFPEYRPYHRDGPPDAA